MVTNAKKSLFSFINIKLKILHSNSILVEMAKSIEQKSSISMKQKKERQAKKYTCGCGKQYVSYPAYSTHRKTKHNNINVEGTFIPKTENPRRGRPSYQFVRKNQTSKLQNLKNYYKSLTVIQLGLLKLNQRFQGKIISQSSQSNHFLLTQELVNMAAYNSDKTQCESLILDIEKLENQVKKLNGNNILFLANIMILFVQLMTTHMTPAPAQALINFISEFILYISSTQRIMLQPTQSQDQDLNQRQDKFDIQMFNQYFSRQQNKEYILKISQEYNLRPEYFVNVSVILSHWIYKLGYCEKVIKIKAGPEVKNED